MRDADTDDEDTVDAASSDGEDCRQLLPAIHVQDSFTLNAADTARHVHKPPVNFSRLLTDYHYVPVRGARNSASSRNSSPGRAAGEDHTVDDEYNNFIFFVRQWCAQYDKFAQEKKFWKSVLSCCLSDDVGQLRQLFTNNTLSKRSSHCSPFLMWVLRQYTLDIFKCICEDCCTQDDSAGESADYREDDGDLIRSALLTVREARAKVVYLIQNRKLNAYKADSKFGCCPMEVAIENIELVTTLIDECGVDVNWQKYPRGQNALNIAINYNAIRTATFLLERGARVDNLFDCFHVAEHKYNNQYAALLRHVIEHSQLSYVHSLLASIAKLRPDSKSAIVNAKGRHWDSCLHVAVESGRRRREVAESERSALLRMSKSRDLVDLLLNYGASVMAVNSDGEIPLHVAARVDNHLAAELLMQDSSQVDQQLTSRDAANDYTPLLTAAAHNSVVFLKVIPIESHHFTAIDRHKRSVIHLAIERMHINTDTYWDCLHTATEVIDHIVKQMQDASADGLDWQDCNKNTALDIAAERADESIVDALLQLAEPADEARRATFLKAAARSKVKTCTAIILLTGGACLRPPDDGQSALHLAAANGCLDLVMLLVSKAADINHQNSCGQTALHAAASGGHTEIVRFLVDKGSKKDPDCVHACDVAGLTPLHYAAMNNHTDIVRCLVQNNGDLLRRDMLGRNVLDVAIDSGHFDVSCIILQSEHWLHVLNNASCTDPAYLSTVTSEQALLLRLDRTVTRTSTTPIENMIETMPQLALFLLNQCETCDTVNDIFVKSSKLLKMPRNDVHVLKAQEWSNKLKVCKRDRHPLMLMVTHRREEIIYHPLISALIKQKTRLPLAFHLLFLLVYLCLVVLTTTFMTFSEFPPQVNWTDNAHLEQRTSQKVLQACILLFIAICVAVELMQIVTMKWKYLRELKNWLDWFCYVSTVLVVCNWTQCAVLTPWQWQLAAFCVLALWINVIFLLRRAPSIGFYIFLIQSGVEMFMSLFIILFIFIVGYAFAFHLLLQNQTAFASPGEAVIKTAVMLTGEQDFTDIFYSNSNEYSEQVFYKKSAYVIYMLFVTSVLIVVFNIVVGLIVGNISDLMKNARLLQSKLLVELALDFEQHQQKLLPNCLKQSARPSSSAKKNEHSKFVCRYADKCLKWLKLAFPTMNTNPLLEDNTEQLLKHIKQQNEELVRAVAALSNNVSDLQQQLVNLKMQR